MFDLYAQTCDNEFVERNKQKNKKVVLKMLVVYKRKNGVWNRVGQLSSVAYDTDEKISKGIKKLESRYLFNHHDYLVESVDKIIHFENGKIQEV